MIKISIYILQAFMLFDIVHSTPIAQAKKLNGMKILYQFNDRLIKLIIVKFKHLHFVYQFNLKQTLKIHIELTIYNYGLYPS